MPIPLHTRRFKTPAQSVENVLGEFGGMDGKATFHDGSLVKWYDRIDMDVQAKQIAG
jgi:hypothetical protein